MDVLGCSSNTHQTNQYHETIGANRCLEIQLPMQKIKLNEKFTLHLRGFEIPFSVIIQRRS